MSPAVGVPERPGAEAVLSVYAAALIVLPSRYTVGSFALTGAMVIGVVLGALWVAGFVTGRPTSLLAPGAGRALLLFSVLTVLAYTITMVTPNLESAVSAADRRMAATVCGVAAALLALDGLASRAAIERVLSALAWAGGVMAAIGILQYGIGWDVARELRLPGFGSTGPVSFIHSRGGQTRVAGTTRHPIEFGILCAVLLPVALHLATHSRQPRDRRYSAIAAALLAIGLPMGLSRASVLAALAAMAVLVWLLPRARRRRLLSIGLAATAAFVVVLPNLARTLRDLFTTDLAEGSNAARAASAQIAIEHWQEAPLLGQGLGTLGNVIVDNQYLLTLAEMGIIGLVGVVALWLGVVRAVRDARRVGDPESRDLGATLLAMIAAIAVASGGFATLGQGTALGLTLFVVGLAGAHRRVTLAEAASTASAHVESVGAGPAPLVGVRGGS